MYTFYPRKSRKPTKQVRVLCGDRFGDTHSAQKTLQTILQTTNPEDIDEYFIKQLSQVDYLYIKFKTVNTAIQLQQKPEFTSRKLQYYDLVAKHKSLYAPQPISSPKSIPGLEITENFLTNSEANFLISSVDKLPWEEKKDYKCVKESNKGNPLALRRVQHYGVPFRRTINNPLDTPENNSLPEFSDIIVSKLHALGLSETGFDQLTVNDYPPMAGIVSHIDSHSAFEDCIAAISVGCGIAMRFIKRFPGERKIDQTAEIWLPANSLLVLRGEARYCWEHGISTRISDQVGEQLVMRERRVSFTFRASKKEEKCKCDFSSFCDNKTGKERTLPSRIADAVPMQRPPKFTKPTTCTASLKDIF